MNLNDRVIAVIGLGYVGLPLAIEYGKKYRVIGFDIYQARVDELNRGEDHTLEADLVGMKQARDTYESTKKIGLTFTSNIEDLKQVNTYIVTVPTPIDRFNNPDLTPLLKASETIGKTLQKGDLVIYESTVYPGCTEEDCVPVLEKFSGLKFNEDFYCGYSPERINPGDKVNTLTKIKKITSGSTPEIADLVRGPGRGHRHRLPRRRHRKGSADGPGGGRGQQPVHRRGGRFDRRYLSHPGKFPAIN